MKKDLKYVCIYINKKTNEILGNSLGNYNERIKNRLIETFWNVFVKNSEQLQKENILVELTIR